MVNSATSGMIVQVMPNLAALAVVPRVLLLAAVAVLLAAWQDRQLPGNKDRVQFESARYQVGPLQLRLALERGESIQRPPAGLIDGYLTMPEGDGPFPALVHLHGCGGLPKAFKNGTERLWPERLAAWGYVVLSVDSFTTRGIDNTCSGEPAPRVADAYGALAYLAQLPLVDAKRIAVIGFSAGGIATLSVVGRRDFDLFEGEHRFKAAVAFYPYCRPGRTFAIPTLILIGEADDWTPASLCGTMVSIRRNDDPVRLVVYPGAHHGFDAPSLRPGRMRFGHWSEYNAAAAEQATEEVRRFLAEQLAR
jgi:dienelactone hydrolase